MSDYPPMSSTVHIVGTAVVLHGPTQTRTLMHADSRTDAITAVTDRLGRVEWNVPLVGDDWWAEITPAEVETLCDHAQQEVLPW